MRQIISLILFGLLLIGTAFVSYQVGYNNGSLERYNIRLSVSP